MNRQFLTALGAILALVAPSAASADIKGGTEGSGAAACATAHQHLESLDDRGPFGTTFSEPDAPRHEPPDTPIDFLHLTGDVSIDPQGGTISGTVELRLQAAVAPQREVLVHAGIHLTIDAVMNEAGEPLTYSHDDEALVVQLSKPVQPSQPIAIRIRFHGEPREGLHFVRAQVGGKRVPEAWTQGETTFNRDWIPLWDYPNERFTSEMTIRVPRGYTAIGNGALVDKRTEDKEEVFHYRQDVDHVGYLLSLNVGRFTIVEKMWNDIPLWYVVYPEDLPNVERGLGRTPEIMTELVKSTGRAYPYAKYSQTVASSYPLGGMENVSATTVGRQYVIYDESAGLIHDGAGLVAHEAAHQWFGDLITCRDWAHMWLNEGFASYFEVVVFGALDGPDKAFEEMRGMRDWYLSETKRYTRPIVTYHFDRPGSIFDAHTYSKGGWVLHMLRSLLGDKLFFDGIKRYVSLYEGKLVETPDFIRVMEAASGRNLHAFFAQWVYGAGHPVLDIDISSSDEGVRIAVDQETDEPFHFPLPVRVTYADGTRDDRTFEIRDASVVFLLDTPEEPQTVEIDPEGTLLKEMTLGASTRLLTAQMEHGSTAQTRTDAAEAFADRANNSSPAVVDSLAGVAGSADHRMVRTAATEALAGIRTQGACAALLSLATADEPRVRREAATALGTCGGSSARKALSNVVRNDKSLHVAAAAFNAMGGLEEEVPRRLLIQGLDRRSWREKVAAGAARGLAKIGKRWALDTLLNRVQRRNAPSELRRAILGTLDGIVRRHPDWLDPVLADVRPLVRDDDMFVLRDALRLIAKIGTSEDLRHLDEGIGRLPAKWYHKEVSRWRRSLRRRIAGLDDREKAASELLKMRAEMEKLESRIRELEAN